MSLKTIFIVPLCELVDGQEADVFALLSAKEKLSTRDGRPYFRVAFRDARREVSFPIWDDHAHARACRDEWTAGEFYKLRCVYRDTDYGPQLDIKKIRAVEPKDRDDGFSEQMCQPASRYEPQTVFNDLVAIAQEHIADEALRKLVVGILVENRETLLTLPAATHNHHAFVGGWLEHVRSVVQTVLYLVAKYQAYYDDLRPPLSKDVAVAGAILHDIGKTRELQLQPQGAVFSTTGELIGHVLQGRDIVREYAAREPQHAETLLRLEHLIVAHQRLPEWGSPKPPMTPEALIVHYADDLDAKLNMFYGILRDEPGDGPLTTGKNALRQRIYRGENT